ncbi:non-ribosomal peptide synthetase [Pseudonocardia xishanensis]|uniref:Amino acid adenylation domain-containing protein n=1 Tax=Pseudonocardia xishanensis TaxID=630995 RepID=A0ABP8RQP5_9PSEU
MSAPTRAPDGVATAVPRWTLHPTPGRGVCEAPLRGPAPDDATLLAAHAVVLAALSGERAVVTAVSTPEGPRPCAITTGGTWRDVHAAAAAALERATPAAEGAVEAVVGDGPAGDEVLRVSVRGDTLRVAYRTEALDAGAAARIADYHVTALGLIAADPDAVPGSLVSADELLLQRTAFHGPARTLPDRRVHQLVADRARRRPDAVAVTCGDTSWTYAELLERADRLARALLARGLGPEDVVAVVTERDLDWAAAVLAVFRAGGAYLPVEPHFPADRIARMLRRAGCRLALVGAVDGTLPAGVESVPIGSAYAEDHPDVPTCVPVGPDRLAYVYFTSGSTGEPKGAMCEHAGMLNHVLAKIGDLGITEGTVVAQTAPQCFDISLWQLVAPWVAGGRTLIVEQAEILEVPRFLDRLVAGRVEVAQLVPSYLEAVLTCLDAEPRALPDLRCVSATGEALKAELAQRWFTTGPGVRLVNAYGLTETSDDTNHHVMDAAPEGPRVPLGRPIANVGITVVDDRGDPVPLGAPGEIVFSGVCVGRGYIGDPERTRAAFVPDPAHPGTRRYRAGDHGRWRPDGTLEFLGRKDTQVKVSGFRIEIGEIENALLAVPGVRDGAVVVPGGTRLVAFLSGPDPVPAAELAARLGERLPWYMVPTAFHWRDALPLTANSKIDRRALTALAEDHAGPVDPTRTAAERAVARAWADQLGVPVEGIGRSADFAELGGSSLAAVKVVLALGRAVTLAEVVERPVLADLAALLATRVPTTAPEESR